MATPEPSLTSRRDPWRLLLGAILLGSLGLRLLLVMRGGQFYWSDENRYQTAYDAAVRLIEGDLAGGLGLLLRTADHVLFKMVAVVPALMQIHAGHPGYMIPGVFFAGFSVLNIYLVWRLARQAGAGTRESAIAALFMAGAGTQFYYARHFFPYDLALSFGLLAMIAGWSGQGHARSWWCGVAAGLGFLAYNGSWLFGAMVLIGHTVLALPDWRRFCVRALVAGMGLAMPIVAVIALARWSAGSDLVQNFLHFAGTINQGDFGQGWRVLAGYFWSAEGFNFVAGGLALVLAAVGAGVARRWTYGLNWVAGALFLLAGLVVLSDVWPVFVVYGRTARVMVPLVCLAGAFVWERLWRTGPGARWAAGFLLVVVIAQAATSLARPLAQEFPGEFQTAALTRMKEIQATGDRRQMLIFYTDQLLNEAAFFKALPDHDVLMAKANPMQFRPYQYEGHTARMRELIRTRDVRMQLIAVNRSWFKYPVALCEPYPGVVQLSLRLPQDKSGHREPLLVTGSTGAGNLIYVIYDQPSAIRLGYDYWSFGEMISESVEVDYNKPVDITLSMGPLHEDGRARLGGGGDVAGPDFRHWLYAEVNGRVVWSQPAEYHPAAPASITYGMNYIGGSTCEAKFTGQILDIKSLLLPNIPTYRANLRQPHPGAIRIVAQLPLNRPGVREPLLAAGQTGAADLIYLIYDSPTTVRFGFDHWAVSGLVSEPVRVDYNKPVTITLSAGFLHDPAAAGAALDPRKMLHVEVNGQVVWSQRQDFYLALPESVTIGRNAVGASTAEPEFSGKILEVESIPLPEPATH